MARFSSSWTVWGVAALLTVWTAGGCSPTPEQRMKDAFRSTYRENGRRLVAMYARFMESPDQPIQGPNDFKGPSSEKELREFIRKTPAEALAEMGISGADSEELFKSERDGQPFRIRYGIKGGLSKVYAVVCESRGVNGTIKVFRSNGSSVEVPAEDMDDYMSGARDEQPPSP